MKNKFTRSAALVALAITATTGLVACGGSSSSDTTVAADTTVAGELVLDGAWARTSAAGATMGAAYLTITSPVDDALTDVKADASIAGMAQIHEVVMASDTTMAGSMSSDSTMAPEMKMQEVDEIALPAGEAVQLKPGGYHIMLMELAKPLAAGTTIDLTLVFKNQGEKTVTFTVQDDAP